MTVATTVQKLTTVRIHPHVSARRWQLPVLLFFLTVLAGRFGLERIDPSYEKLGPLAQPRYWLFIALLLSLTVVRPNLGRRFTLSWKLRRFCWWVVLLHLYLALSTLWSPIPTEALDQVSEVLLLAGIVLITPRLFNRSPHQRISLLLLLLYATAIVYALGGMGGRWTDEGRMAAFGGGPNVFVRIAGMGILVSLFFWLKTSRIRWLIPMPLLATVAILSGSRGGLLSLVIAILFFLGFTLQKNRRKILTLAFVVGTLGLLTLTQFASERILPFWQERYVQETFEDRDDAERRVLAATAIAMVRDHPLFGIGLDGFRQSSGLDEYAHNLVFQVSAEGGLLGLILMSAAIVPVLCTMPSASSLEEKTVYILGAFNLLAEMFSGTYYDGRYMWLFFAMYLVLKQAASIPSATAQPRVLSHQLTTS